MAPPKKAREASEKEPKPEAEEERGASTSGAARSRYQAEVEELKAELERTRKKLALEERKLRLLTELGSDAVFTSDARGNITASNQRVADITGLSAHELIRGVGKYYTVSNRSKKVLHVEDLPVRKALDGQRVRDAELTFHFKDYDVTLLANSAPLFDDEGGIEGTVTTFQDISQRIQGEQRSELVNVLTRMLSTGGLEAKRFRQIAKLVGEVMGGWTVLGLAHPDDEEIDIVASFHPNPRLNRELAALFDRIRILKSTDPGMGRVATSGEPLLITEPPGPASMPASSEEFRELFCKLGCSSLLFVPLRARGNTLGVLLLASLPAWPGLNKEDLEYTQRLVDRIAITLDSIHLLADLKKKEWRMRMLAQISRTFATSLDVLQVAHTVAVQLTEALADWCVLGLLDERGNRLEPVAVYHRKTKRLRALEKVAATAGLAIGHGIPGQVVSTQTPILFERFDEERLRTICIDEGHRRLLLEQKPASYLCVPISVGDIPLGFVDLACDPGGKRHLGNVELELVRELASRAASALQNAQLFEQLQSVIHAKDEWLSVASHELKTPLTPLQVLLQLMIRKLSRNQPIDVDHLERCLTQVNKLTRLINDLLDVTRLQVGQLDLDTEILDIRSLVESVTSGFRETSDIHEIVLEPGGEGLIVMADRSRIEQVMVNLIHNSIKYSPEGGATKIAVRGEGAAGKRRAIVSVTDQGIGIPLDEHPRLFQRYFRGSNVPERNYGGLGLGLWISNQIIVRHRGELTAESQPGEGSCFTFWLPLAGDTPKSDDKSHPRVLLVDDDEGSLEVAAECLMDEGYDVALARNGQVAETILSEQGADVVVLDLMMPMMDGWELMGRISKLPHCETMKVIVMSATRDVYSRAHELGAWDYLSKPFELDELLASVTKALSRPSSKKKKRSTKARPPRLSR